MRSRAYDDNGVIHLTPFKGSRMPSCTPPNDEHDFDPVEEQLTILSPMFLSHDTPVTCVKCISIEVQLVQEETSEESDE